MLENKDYCDYETCVALNELGCPITKWISGDVVSTFTLYEAQKWLREEKDIHIEVIHSFLNEKDIFNVYVSTSICVLTKKIGNDSYESALSEGIKEAVKILKEELNEEA